MLISKTVITKWNPRNKIWYETKGYIFTRWYDEIEVRIEDLFKSSNCLVEVQCDNCGKIFKITWATYQNRDNIYCKTCANKLYGSENVRLSKLKNGTSFEQWCKNNNRQDILDRWDYELNNCKPNEIGYATNKKCYFKCPNELHNSELKNINSFTNKYYKEKDIMCNQCNSFGQYLINTYGESGIIKYWSEQNIVNPFEIAKMSNSKYYIKCQEKGYHEDYAIACYNFVNGNRCPFLFS